MSDVIETIRSSSSGTVGRASNAAPAQLAAKVKEQLGR